MVNFIDLIDLYIAERQRVSVSTDRNLYKGILDARGDDYIVVEGKYDRWMIPIDKIVVLSAGIWAEEQNGKQDKKGG